MIMMMIKLSPKIFYVTNKRKCEKQFFEWKQFSFAVVPYFCVECFSGVLNAMIDQGQSIMDIFRFIKLGID